jgi:hypothetical protein
MSLRAVSVFAFLATTVPLVAQMRPVNTEISAETQKSIEAAHRLTGSLTEGEKNTIIEALARVSVERNETELATFEFTVQSRGSQRPDEFAKLRQPQGVALDRKTKDLDRLMFDLTDRLVGAGLSKDAIGRAVRAQQKSLRDSKDISELAGSALDLRTFIQDSASLRRSAKLSSYLAYLAKAIVLSAQEQGIPSLMRLLVDLDSSVLKDSPTLHPYLETLLLREIVKAPSEPDSEVPSGYSQTVVHIASKSTADFLEWNLHHTAFNPSVSFLKFELEEPSTIFETTGDLVPVHDEKGKTVEVENKNKEGWSLLYLVAYSVLAIGNQPGASVEGDLSSLNNAFSKAPVLSGRFASLIDRANARRQTPRVESLGRPRTHDALAFTSENRETVILDFANRINQAQGIVDAMDDVRATLEATLPQSRAATQSILATLHSAADPLLAASAALILLQFELSQGDASEVVLAYVRERSSDGFHSRPAKPLWDLIADTLAQRLGKAHDPFGMAYREIFQQLTSYPSPTDFEGVNRERAVLTMVDIIPIQNMTDAMWTELASFMLNDAVTAGNPVYRQTLNLILKSSTRDITLPASARQLLEQVATLKTSDVTRDHPELNSFDFGVRKQEVQELAGDGLWRPSPVKWASQ